MNYIEKDFFLKNKDCLELNYPGVSYHILQRRLEEYYQVTQRSLIIDLESRLLKGEPIEYILGFKYFYDSLFLVNKDVLIPRQETELLVELALQEKKIKSVLDLCTGSGCIGLSYLKHKSNIELILSDISEDAINLARENYFRLNYSFGAHSIQFIQSDLFENINNKFDLIISNPPYIKQKDDLFKVHHTVNQFEPHLALYLEDSKYDNWFENYFSQCFNALNDSGVLLMEGHEDHLRTLSLVAKRSGFQQVEVLNDFTNRYRFIRARKN